MRNFLVVFLGVFCVILIGKQQVAMKWDKGRGGFENKGPWLNAKRVSLMVASHERKKEVGPAQEMEVRFNGRYKKRKMTGNRSKNLVVPCAINMPTP